MEPLPHRYHVEAAGGDDGALSVTGPDLSPLSIDMPREFGGPGQQWSPETLLIAAVVGCFVLTFRAIATASKLGWAHLSCDAEGTIDRVDGTTRFTTLALRAHLVLPAETDREKAVRLLEKAERSCLVTNSLALRPVLHCELEVA